MAEAIWRDPPEASPDLYPGLFITDNVGAGAILDKSGSPLWAFVYESTVDGWLAVAANYELRWTAEDMGRFLCDLLGVRGEFARLLLVLADEERQEREADRFSERPWWDLKLHRDRVLQQLRLCVATLEALEAKADHG